MRKRSASARSTKRSTLPAAKGAKAKRTAPGAAPAKRAPAARPLANGKARTAKSRGGPANRPATRAHGEVAGPGRSPARTRSTAADAALQPETRERELGWSPEGDPVPASRGKYVYCIIEASDQLRFGPIGIGADPSEVYSVHYRNLAAVVSDAPLEVLDSTREHVFAHERVNETVMREHTVIPMSFGTIFKTREDIVELLRSAAEAFGDVLNKMQNKLEFGLKVLWDRDQAIRELENDDEDIGRLKKELSSQKGPTYFARMQYGRLVDAALQARSERYVSEILDELRDVSVASRVNKPIGDKMIMNVAFLIFRDREAEFDARVKAIASRFDRLTFKYTGPWPPYNFVNIRLKLERA